MLQKLKALLPDKLKALAVHMSMSIGIFAVILYLILFRWYPGPWFAIDGGWEGVRIMIFVDLVLGPALTFIIFNPHKTRLALRIDFSTIALVQAGALSFGIYLVNIQRPLAIVYSNGAFHSADDLSLQKQNLLLSALASYGDRLPVLIHSEHPTTKAGKNELYRKIFQEGVAEYEQSQLFRPWKANREKAFSDQVEIQALAEKYPDIKTALERLLKKHPGSTAQDFRFVPFSGRYEDAILVFEPDGTLVDALPPKPPTVPSALPANEKDTGVS